jgi:hypothetical protein
MRCANLIARCKKLRFLFFRQNPFGTPGTLSSFRPANGLPGRMLLIVGHEAPFRISASACLLQFVITHEKCEK